MKSPVAGRARNSSAQCCHHTATGRRCRSARSSSESCLCPRHRAVEQKLLSAESDDLTPEFTDLEDSLQTVEGIHTSLSELYILVAQDRVSPRRAAVLAYVSSLLLRSLPPVKKAAPKPPARPVSWNWADLHYPSLEDRQKLAGEAEARAAGLSAANSKDVLSAANKDALSTANPKPEDVPNAASIKNVPSATNVGTSPTDPSSVTLVNRSVPVNTRNVPSAPSLVKPLNGSTLLDQSSGMSLGNYENYHDDVTKRRINRSL